MTFAREPGNLSTKNGRFYFTLHVGHGRPDYHSNVTRQQLTGKPEA